MTVPALPFHGEALWARLFYRVGNTWLYQDVRYTAPDLPDPALASPLAGATLDAGPAEFRWTANGTPVTQWWLYAGSRPGARDHGDSGALDAAATSHAFANLPYRGEAVHVRLWWQVRGRWHLRDHAFTAATVPDPQVTSPAPQAVLDATSVGFSWRSNGTPVTQWWLYAGSRAGARDHGDSGALDAAVTSHTFSGLPFQGETVWLRLYYKVRGAWRSRDYRYTAADAAPAITQPVPGSTLAGASVSFAWAANLAPVSRYWLYVGSSPGARDLHDSGALAPGTLSRNVARLPVAGAAVHVRLYFEVGGRWLYADAAYTASGSPPRLTSHADGDTAGNGTRLAWTPGGAAVTQWWLYVGTTRGGRQVGDSGALAAQSASHVLTGVPAGGALWVRLYWRVDGAWRFADYRLVPG